ncbi:energy-coupling factor transport system permease protein [Carnobacterium iners]|uniref:Energy-coupling factor transport system permease protein n=1 Tax=Carnobacterium iners TaxID=1073423 RepID=A0A1X7NN70_9LACT|nr:HAD family hydrolase [Carnobacterium iners]SEK69050.1 energy-coupling factor transport system permease protein [Carnobacterium iners]SMH39006.1 energy-coupling factor transport system permease protein [Carnobacterium iners]
MTEVSTFKQVKEFHAVFNPTDNSTPTALTSKEALNRANFSTEEIIEFLYASVQGDLILFEKIIQQWEYTINKTVAKIKIEKKEVKSILVGQVDALIDANYFNYGSFVLMGVDPTPISTIVHEANMGKLFPDGKPHYRLGDGKVLKPKNWEQEYAPETRIETEIEKQIKEKRGKF